MENRFIDMGDTSNYLEHFGVRGQKWGRRNPIGPDGRIVGSKFARIGTTADDSSSGYGSSGGRSSGSSSSGSSGGRSGSSSASSKKKSWADANLNEEISGDPKKRKMSRAEYGMKNAKTAVDAAGDIARTYESRKATKAEIGMRQKAKTMTDEDLDREIARLSKEQRYASLKSTDLDNGKATASDMLSTVGDVLAIGASAATIATTIYMYKQATK